MVIGQTLTKRGSTLELLVCGQAACVRVMLDKIQSDSSSLSHLKQELNQPLQLSQHGPPASDKCQVWCAGND